jgi:translation initiation factor eIF-2B subunit gamma
LLYYSLKWIEQTTKDIIICCYPTAKEKISSYVHKVYDSALNIKVLEVPEGCGSADALRHLHKEIKQDFIIYSCDLITDIPPQVLINTHYAKNNTMTAFYYDATAIETPDSIKTTGEVVGITDKTSQIIYVESKEDLKLQGEIMIKHSILKNFPSLRIYSTLRDAHLYIFKRWVLELMIKNHSIQSIKNDLIPLLVDLQHRKSLRAKEGIETFQQKYNPDLFEKARMISLGGKNYLQEVACGAVIYNKGLNCRSNTIRNYSELNRAICKNTPSSVPSTCDIHQRTTVPNIN